MRSPDYTRLAYQLPAVYQESPAVVRAGRRLPRPGRRAQPRDHRTTGGPAPFARARTPCCGGRPTSRSTRARMSCWRRISDVRRGGGLGRLHLPRQLGRRRGRRVRPARVSCALRPVVAATRYAARLPQLVLAVLRAVRDHSRARGALSPGALQGPRAGRHGRAVHSHTLRAVSHDVQRLDAPGGSGRFRPTLRPRARGHAGLLRGPEDLRRPRHLVANPMLPPGAGAAALKAYQDEVTTSRRTSTRCCAPSSR